VEFTIKEITQRMRWINPGKFLMGSPENEPDRNAESELHHEVVLSKGFWLADTACTQELWQEVMGANPSNFKSIKRPVENVSWNECGEFLKKLNGMVSDLNFCLPTEAQWEYACRASTATPFSFGENITPEQVNYNGDYPYHGEEKGIFRKQTVDVKSLPSNQWGLYEMHGNVWEWCADWYGDYPKGSVNDPLSSAEGLGRVLRGGPWIGPGWGCRSAVRNWFDPGNRNSYTGFRFSRGHPPHEVQTSEQPPSSPERSDGSQAL
jgi:formylglycine-generating enzyme required for sulfatase activity